MKKRFCYEVFCYEFLLLISIFTFATSSYSDFDPSSNWHPNKGSLISEGILTLVPLPTKGAKSVP